MLRNNSLEGRRAEKAKELGGSVGLVRIEELFENRLESLTKFADRETNMRKLEKETLEKLNQAGIGIGSTVTVAGPDGETHEIEITKYDTKSGRFGIKGWPRKTSITINYLNSLVTSGNQDET